MPYTHTHTMIYHTHTHTHTLAHIAKDTQAPDPTTGTNAQTPQTLDALTHSPTCSTGRNWLTDQTQNTDGLMVVCACTGRDTRRQYPAKTSSKRPVGKDVSSHQHLDI